MVKEVIKSLNLKGEIEIPADKSISHRAVMFSAISKGICEIKNFSKGMDCISTLELFKALGIEAKFNDNLLIINSKSGLKAPCNELNCGNSGTTMRLCSGILSGENFDSILVGDESLMKRPMARILKPLRQMGAKIQSDGCAPLKIFSSNLQGIDYVSNLSSAQVKSCVLLAGLKAKGHTSYVEPYLSRNHSELMLEYMGAEISQVKVASGIKTKISPCELVSKNINVVGDISSAAFFIVAALIIPNSSIIIRNVGLNPTRTGILDVVKMMGADIEILDKHVESGELVGDLKVQYSDLKSCEISKDLIPRLIDELPVIAVLATQAKGETIIKDAQDLRNKESDRIKSIVEELKKIGANIEETNDGFKIIGKTPLKGDCELETYHDHRLAMSFYVAGLICDKPILIKNFEWVNISFPEFETLMNKLA